MYIQLGLSTKSKYAIHFAREVAVFKVIIPDIFKHSNLMFPFEGQIFDLPIDGQF